jgi:outer membrane murein-binding lipoprotein Lpp
MHSLRKSIATAGIVVLGGLSLSACATTDYVDEQIAAVNARIDGIEARVQENAAAAAAANQAVQAASAQAASANQRIDALTGRVDSLEQRMASKAPRN